MSLCSKLNAQKTFSAQVICHGVPDAYELQEGDICNIDVTVTITTIHIRNESIQDFNPN